MARPHRIGALFLMNARGYRCGPIVEDHDDRPSFLNVLADVVERFNWRCHAYCLMTRHYHLVVETPDGNLSNGIRQLNGLYTQAAIDAPDTYSKVASKPTWWTKIAISSH